MLKGLHLVVDLDAQGLKDLCQLGLLSSRIDCAFERIEQVACGFYRSLGACSEYGSHYWAGLAQVSPEAKHTSQVMVGISVDHLSCRERSASVHAHVKRRVGAEGETA